MTETRRVGLDGTASAKSPKSISIQGSPRPSYFMVMAKFNRTKRIKVSLTEAQRVKREGRY